ncbi:MAG TPA: O-antigen ligase family protein, partial [Bacteroidetes bacterium]|nr:O-antigen ligase family protein [Bacteroidota bacterium]HEX03795.1 O-antigen ligase family protein [Bacteroidota bacterium]
MQRSSERVRAILFHSMAVATTVIVPFSFSTATLDPGIYPRFLVWTASLTVLAGMLVWASWKYPDIRSTFIWKNSLLGFGLLYLLASACGFMVALNQADWLYATLRTAMLFAHIFIFTQILILNLERWQKLIWYVSITGFVIALIGVLQWSGGMFLIGSFDPPYGTMMHENIFATFLFLSTPLAIYGAIIYKGFSRWFFILTLGQIVFAIVVSTTRSVWVAITVGAALTGLIHVITDHKLRLETIGRTGIQKRWAALLLSIILIGSAGSFLYFVSDKFDAIEERSILWKVTARLSLDHPILGVGAGNWVQHTNIENLQNKISHANWIRPHNDPLWVISETGVIGLIGYLGMFLAAFWMLWRVLRKTERFEVRLLALALTYGLLGFLIISNSSFPRERIELTSYFAMFLALSIFVHSLEFKRDTKTSQSQILPLTSVVLVLLGAFAGYVGYYRYDGEKHVTRAHAALSADLWQQALPEIEKARNPFYTAHPNGLSLDYMRGISLYELERYEEAKVSFLSS